MRMLTLPAACVLSLCLYLPLPQAEGAFLYGLEALYQRFESHFTAKQHALPAFLLLLFSFSSLLGALHPAVCALLMAPLFTAPAALPGCARTKRELDSGKYARDISAYEQRVREACLSLAPAFIGGAAAPMILCALGMPLYIGCGLGWVYAALRVLHTRSKPLSRALMLALRVSGKAFSFLMLLCAGAVGRNPLRVRGANASSLLLSILGIAQDGTKTHDPMAGDIAQGAFLCCMCSALLLLTLTLTGMAFC